VILHNLVVKQQPTEVCVGDGSQTRTDAAGWQKVFQNNSTQKDQREQCYERDGHPNQIRKKKEKRKKKKRATSISINRTLKNVSFSIYHLYIYIIY